MNDPKPQLIKFIQACPPSLDDGQYRIRVNQDSDIATPDKPVPELIQEFSVSGPRFSIDPNEINSTYPPENQTGFYNNCLPHVIISRKTFAWERSIYGDKANRINANNQPIDVVPWVALLCFSKEEAPELVRNTSKAIISPEQDIITGKISLDSHLGESENTPCNTIDLECIKYEEIGPHIDELQYLAHAKYVDIENKVVNGSIDGYYSVIIGNRFPLATEAGEVNIAHLVSLEGLGDFLPGGKTPVTDQGKKFRFISLASWQYIVKSDKLEFKKLITNLSPGKTLSVPVATGLTQSSVKNALEMGYTAMKHNLRNGEKTVSWYRGPLVPLKIDTAAEKVYPCADSALKYDPTTGMFDISYSSAWQIGRMLALQNKTFATALYQWRRKNNQEQAFQQMRSVLKSRLGNTFNYSNINGDSFGDTLIRSLAIKYWQNDLGPKLKPSDQDNTGLLGKHGDPAGLLKNAGKIKGLLSMSDIKNITQKTDDPVSLIINKVKEKK